DASRNGLPVSMRLEGGKRARLVSEGPGHSAADLVRALPLPRSPVILVIGGAGTLDADIATRLRALFERGVIRAATASGATLVDGGTAARALAVLAEAD